MVRGSSDEMKKEQPKNHFNVGIVDDVSNSSLDWDPEFFQPSQRRGSAACSTASARTGHGRRQQKTSIKIIGEELPTLGPGILRVDRRKGPL